MYSPIVPKPRIRSAPRVTGFTLIEMLVAASLVVMMMAIFAEIFQLASGSMTLQRALAENDQQVRTAVTVLRGDFSKRSFRNLVPFFPGENHEQAGVPFGNREGYFYVNMNDPNSGVDNVLQFTVRSTITNNTADDSPYYGRAIAFGDLRLNPNQPDADDGEILANGSASSTTAQVCYFVRNGNLYRRVVLLREPLPVSKNSGTSAIDVNPRDRNNNSYFDATNGLYTPGSSSSYWNDFDFSAIRSATLQSIEMFGANSERNDLDNQHIPARPYTQFSLGRTWNRFGFDQASGLSREFFGSSNNVFLGRFTHQETSDPDFQFPFGFNPVTNPFSNATVLNDTSPADGIPDGYESGNRAGEDILLTNVHSFDIELWDDGANGGSGGFVAIGSGSDYSTANCLNQSYTAPRQGAAYGYCFDTWHPFYDRDGDTFPDPPPYRPLKYDPAKLYDPVLNPARVWRYDITYTPGDIVFPPTEDANYNGHLDPTEDGTKGYATDGLLDQPTALVRVPVNPSSRTLYYVCRRGTTSSTTRIDYTNQPAWSGIPGFVFGHDLDPQMELWEAVSNVKPVRSIRITLRFLHRGSNKLRQVTLVHSLRDQ